MSELFDRGCRDANYPHDANDAELAAADAAINGFAVDAKVGCDLCDGPALLDSHKSRVPQESSLAA